MKVSHAILSIRASAGNPNKVCPTCGHAPEAPYRSRFNGHIVMGCIDAAHTGHLTGDNKDWHNRKHCREFRREELSRLLSY